MANRGVHVQFLGSGDAFGDGGRYQACILIQTAGARMLMDCGATSLTAMKRFGVDPGSIDAVIVSHYNADHYGGIPFLVLDGQFSHRTKPLTIAGPGSPTTAPLRGQTTTRPRWAMTLPCASRASFLEDASPLIGDSHD